MLIARCFCSAAEARLLAETQKSTALQDKLQKIQVCAAPYIFFLFRLSGGATVRVWCHTTLPVSSYCMRCVGGGDAIGGHWVCGLGTNATTQGVGCAVCGVRCVVQGAWSVALGA